MTQLRTEWFQMIAIQRYSSYVSKSIRPMVSSEIIRRIRKGEKDSYEKLGTFF